MEELKEVGVWLKRGWGEGDEYNMEWGSLWARRRGERGKMQAFSPRP